MDTEQGRLQDIYMSAADELRVVFHDEGEHQHADVHAVVIGICCYDNIIVAQVVQILLYAQGVDEQVQFLVLSHAAPAFLEAVDGFAPQREHRLVVGVAHLGDGTGCGVALRDEDGGFLPLVFHALGKLGVREVVSAIP